MTILEIIQKHGTTITDIAKELDVSVTQIYYWNRKGISANNKHYFKLKQLLPEIIPKEVTVRKNEEEDQRFKSGRKKKELKLKDSDLPEYEEKEFRSSIFPTIRKKPT